MKKFLFAITALVWINLYAQDDGNFWYFGEFAGLDFSTSPPMPISGSLNSVEGCAAVSDDQGNLLFYTDGTTVWDASHNIMQNGNGLWGDPDASQSCVIVKAVYPNRYYIYTIGSSTVHRSLINISDNNGSW